MAIVYKKCVVDGTIPSYVCNPCLEGEKGGIRSTAFINKSLKDEMNAESTDVGVKNIESKAWWEKQIEAGLINVIPTTRGTYDGGEPTMVPGYGDQKEIKSGKTHSLVFSDPNHTGNDDFYNSIEANETEYILAWRTNTELRVATESLTGISAKDATEEDVDSIIDWEVTCTWIQNGAKRNVPIYKLGDVREVFYCIDEGNTP